MDAPTSYQDQLLFVMTGQRQGDGFADVDIGTLCPALLAPYRDLERRRHDYPLVLLEEPGPDGFTLPLAGVVSRLAAELAPRGIEGERLRRHLLRLERELRALVAEGHEGRLADLWPVALERMAPAATTALRQLPADDEAARAVLAQAAETLGAMKLDGELVRCDERVPARLVTMAWRHAQLAKAREFHRVVDALMRQLSDIRRAAWVHSQAGQQPQALRLAVSARHAEAFDFEVMSRLVARRAPADELPAARRQRIEWALAVLSRQTFWPDARAEDPLPQACVFDNCAAAMAAFRERLPEAVELLKAMAVAELEVAGRYVEAEHDAVFRRYGLESLGAEDFALLPDSLVCIPPARNDARENAGLLEMLSSGMPVKVLVQVDDLLQEAAFGTGHFAFGVRAARLATTAMGLGGRFVMQCAVSALPALKARVVQGMVGHGPALFTVFAGSPRPAAGLPRYLTAAAAMEARAFPAFTYDAAAGANWAGRFSLEGNRNAESDWAMEPLEYADEMLQRVRENTAFTYADFALTDQRHAAHFAAVPRERWHAGMVSAGHWLELDEAAANRSVPYVWAAGPDDRLHRVLVDLRLMKAARACLLLWHRLQEHGGIHDSHAERALAQERAKVAAETARAAAAVQAAPASVPALAAAAQGPQAATAAAAPLAEKNGAAAMAAEAKPPSDEAWIETIRCPSCNECQLVNPRMFTYNENKQAYIKDIDAGTYRDLVEAAESCQVAIIHPGKPRNAEEAGLEELLERAKPFL
ncbi:MAG: ferredoxin [Rubrivivax sp.]|nr:ferredoxin [Rubrivivax sp.]